MIYCYTPEQRALPADKDILRRTKWIKTCKKYRLGSCLCLQNPQCVWKAVIFCFLD